MCKLGVVERGLSEEQRTSDDGFEVVWEERTPCSGNRMAKPTPCLVLGLLATVVDSAAANVSPVPWVVLFAPSTSSCCTAISVLTEGGLEVMVMPRA